MAVRTIEHRTKVPEIRKGDTVVVLAGKDAGKRGKVEHVDPARLPSPTPVRSGYRRTSLKGGVFVVVDGPQHRAQAHQAAPAVVGRPGLHADHRSGRHPRSRDAAPREPRDDRVRPLRQADPGRRTASSTTARACACASHCGEPLEVQS